MQDVIINTINNNKQGPIQDWEKMTAFFKGVAL
jgi:hypothetical protein